jgi:hypothetical protein
MTGFKDAIESGEYTPTRTTVSIPPGTSTGGQLTGVVTELGSTYILLGMSATEPCRVRLYSTSQSVGLDNTRPINNFDINPEVGLNLEVFFSDTGTKTLTFDIPVIATALTGSDTWFSVSSSVGVNPQVVATAYTLSNQNLTREPLIISRSVTTTTPVSGSVSSKKSFLILSASASHVSRLRLYSVDTALVPTQEKTRAFGTQPPTGSKLIADLMLDTANFSYKINPVLEAHTWVGSDYSAGANVVYYILENRSGTSPASVTASLHIISLED